MIRTYKYRLKPNKTQDKRLDFLLWQARKIYNAALEQRITLYQEKGETISKYDQRDHFCALRKDEPDTLGLLPYDTVDALVRRLDKAFQAFFRRVKAGDETPGFPRFKGRHRFHSLEYRYGKGCKIKANDNGKLRLYVANAGDIKIRLHRPIPDGAKPKHVVIKRSATGKWHVVIMLELPDPAPAVTTTRPAVGIDMGLKWLLAMSDGSTVDNPRWLRQSLRELRLAKRHLSRCKRGSNRRRKAVRKVAKLYEQVTSKRGDFWHKQTRQLVDTYGSIAIENLTLGFMTRNKHLALSAHDASLGEFRQLLEYKAEEAGTQVVAVNPAYTSQLCSQCGETVKKSLSVRIHRCVSCGLELDRDVNAARNILNLAFNGAGHAPQGTAEVVNSRMP